MNAKDTSRLNGYQVTTRPLISIIIPAYNVEQWLRRSVNTLLAQTLFNFELILVDDGSTDGTGAICDEMASRDFRIHVIHQPNAGAALARNHGMAEAKGEYLYFMDADDWCEPEMLKSLYDFAAEHDLDLLITGFYIDTYYNDHEFYREQRNTATKVYESQAAFREDAYRLFEAQLLYAPWNKLYRRQYLLDHDLEFPSTFWDDLPFNLRVVRDVAKVGCLDGHFYHFLRAREESENTRYRADMYAKREEEDQLMRELFDYWDIDDEAVRRSLSLRYAERLVGCVENVTNKNSQLSTREKREKIGQMIKTERAQTALKEAVPHTLMMRMIFMPMKWQNVTLTLWESSFISWVKRNNTKAFAKLKANR